ncbi:hypothetical protein B0J15DRAFT_477051 [Fusarium solani]|jgi:hypothetical protein|uniref:Uncharacterized protein n=1 Tax=Fusarium solani TaxID=169388 RepID=A0A9P9RBF2_FUSSL|nr:uncharacterized protein B0J15DRAFT_477051 [Fusarium solani]KAH7273396.1 hypothetical protein B0J15DRAFT_477051 [Fusarium solani]
MSYSADTSNFIDPLQVYIHLHIASISHSNIAASYILVQLHTFRMAQLSTEVIIAIVFSIPGLLASSVSAWFAYLMFRSSSTHATTEAMCDPESSVTSLAQYDDLFFSPWIFDRPAGNYAHQITSRPRAGIMFNLRVGKMQVLRPRRSRPSRRATRR